MPNIFVPKVAIYTVFAALVMMSVWAASTKAEVYRNSSLDGRYIVVSGDFNMSSEPAPENRRKAMFLMIDTWTGRTWALSQKNIWQPLAFRAAEDIRSGRRYLPPNDVSRPENN